MSHNYGEKKFMQLQSPKYGSDQFVGGTKLLYNVTRATNTDSQLFKFF